MLFSDLNSDCSILLEIKLVGLFLEFEMSVLRIVESANNNFKDSKEGI